MSFRRPLIGLQFACLALAVGATPARAGMLFSQTTDITNSASSPFGSQNDTSAVGAGNFATVYDNFRLAAGGSVTSVDWTGSYIAGTFTGNPAGSITGFTLSFWANDPGNGGQPDTTAPALAQLSATSFHETFRGSDVGSDAVFTYHATIPTFDAAAGTQYWLSIVPDLALPVEWGWQSATSGGDALGYQDFFGNREGLDSDFAFALESPNATAAPEPSSLVLLISGLVGAPFVRRRARRRVANHAVARSTKKERDGA